MENSWKTPLTNNTSLASSRIAPLPMQIASSTPFQQTPGMVVSPRPILGATKRVSLDLFHVNSFNHKKDRPQRLSLTTDFALSALKSSFSMSSLCHPGFNRTLSGAPPCATPNTPDMTARLKWERPFNSLTRLKERGTNRVQWRRSFGASPFNVKEDLAAKMSDSGSVGQSTTNTDWLGNADYTFLMNCDLIESCRSLNGEMSWDNGDLEHLREPDFSLQSEFIDVNNESEAISSNTSSEVVMPDVHLELQLLRQWLNRMEGKVPQLVMRRKWTRETLERRILEHKKVKREMESYSTEFGVACHRCISRNPRDGLQLENRYHRLLLRIFEWTYYLESLSKKSPEFWSKRKARSNSESEMELPNKQPRLEDPSIFGTVRFTEQVAVCDSDKRFQSEEDISAQVSLESVERNVNDLTRTLSNCSNRSLVRLGSSHESSGNDWIYSPNNSSRSTDDDQSQRLSVSVRKQLNFESEEDNSSLNKSWYQQSSPESTWLHQIDRTKREIDDAHQPKKKVYCELTLFSNTSEVEEHFKNSECEHDTSGELTSEGEEKTQRSPGCNSRKSFTMNRTFLLPESTDTSDLPIIAGSNQKRYSHSSLNLSGYMRSLPTFSPCASSALARRATSDTALQLITSSSSFAHSVAIPGVPNKFTERNPLSYSFESSVRHQCIAGWSNSSRSRLLDSANAIRHPNVFRNASSRRKDKGEAGITSAVSDISFDSLLPFTVPPSYTVSGLDENSCSPSKQPLPRSCNSSPWSDLSDEKTDIDNFGKVKKLHGQKPSPREVFSKDRPDAESIRSLVEFNKYYRDNFETSSKCSSSHNVNIHCHHSDAEESYLLNVIVTSSQFIKALHVFNEMLKCSKQNPTSLEELVADCETNVKCLQTLLSKLEMPESQNFITIRKTFKSVQDVTDKKENMDAIVLLSNKTNEQLRQIQIIRTKLIELENFILSTDVDGGFQLNPNMMQQIKTLLKIEKDSILRIDLDVQSNSALELPAVADMNLKEDVADLYKICQRLEVEVAEKEAALSLDLKMNMAINQGKDTFLALQKPVADFLQPANPDGDLDSRTSSNRPEDYIQLNVKWDSGSSLRVNNELPVMDQEKQLACSLNQLERKMENDLATAGLTPNPVELLYEDHFICSQNVKEVSVQTDNFIPLGFGNEKDLIEDSSIIQVTGSGSASAYLWRILKVALPFQLALFALFLGTFLMESSCSNGGAFGGALFSEFNYIGNPPPI